MKINRLTNWKRDITLEDAFGGDIFVKTEEYSNPKAYYMVINPANLESMDEKNVINLQNGDLLSFSRTSKITVIDAEFTAVIGI
jgi:hypothetical protein